LSVGRAVPPPLPPPDDDDEQATRTAHTSTGKRRRFRIPQTVADRRAVEVEVEVGVEVEVEVVVVVEDRVVVEVVLRTGRTPTAARDD
jgi:hypothetical protein